MVIKRKGAARPSVAACTLLPYDPAFELGQTLVESRARYPSTIRIAPGSAFWAGPLAAGSADARVVIPALNAARTLPRTWPAAGPPPSSSITVCDGGSRDDTVAIARRAGAAVVTAPPARRPTRGRGRGRQRDMAALPACRHLPGAGWASAAPRFSRDSRTSAKAGYFRLRLDSPDPRARRVERLAAWRCRTFGLPYGDQGLLISRTFYRRLGGFRPLPLMEDVDLVRRIGRRNLVLLDADDVTSARALRARRLAAAAAAQPDLPRSLSRRRPARAIARLVRIDDAPSRHLRPRAAARPRQAPARARYRRAGGDALLPLDARPADRAHGARSALDGLAVRHARHGARHPAWRSAVPRRVFSLRDGAISGSACCGLPNSAAGTGGIGRQRHSGDALRRTSHRAFHLLGRTISSSVRRATAASG